MMSMTIIYDFDSDKWMRQKEDEHATIFQNYMNNKYKATHKGVTKREFWECPKMFIYSDHISIVTGNQKPKGGHEYVRHCKTFDCSVDRTNGIVFLKERVGEDNLKSIVSKLLMDGVTLNRVSEELNYRDNSNMNWDDALFEYSTKELEEIESEMEKIESEMTKS